MNSLNDLLTSLKEWLEAELGRTVVLEEIRGEVTNDVEQLPVLVITLHGRPDPHELTLEGVIARWVGVTFTSVGRNEVDCQWLDAKLLAVLAGPLPTGLAADIVFINPEPAATLRAVQGRMLAAHRVALAFR